MPTRTLRATKKVDQHQDEQSNPGLIMADHPPRRQHQHHPRLSTVSAWLLLFLACYNYVRVRWYLPRQHDSLAQSPEHSLPPKTTRHGNNGFSHAAILGSNQDHHRRRWRLLYIITSMHEKDTGHRETILDYDRFGKTLLPLLKESVSSLWKHYDVDVYLITQYSMNPRQYQAIRNVLPDQVGLQVWSEATPLGYDYAESSSSRLEHITRALSRQHRYVIKDKWANYDVFVNFEDDMLIKADHVQQFIDTTQLLYNLRRTASNALAAEGDVPQSARDMLDRFHGPMTSLQLERMIPGFIRVEVNLGKGPDSKLRNHCGQERNRFPNIPQDYDWNASLRNATIDAKPCCHWERNEMLTNMERLLSRPAATDLYYWETGIEALGVRQLPNGDWYVLQVGNREDKYNDSRLPIGDYWSGRDGYFAVEPPGGGFAGDQRPDRTKGRYANNQGGWMATRRQIIDWHRKWCRGGGFLPPYDPPGYPFDGLDSRSVEYWSGGLQLAFPLGCNLQRIVTLDPTKFGRHLLYHTSNNKQRSMNVEHRFSGLSIQEFWAQVNTVRKNAERFMKTGSHDRRTDILKS